MMEAGQRLTLEECSLGGEYFKSNQPYVSPRQPTAKPGIQPSEEITPTIRDRESIQLKILSN